MASSGTFTTWCTLYTQAHMHMPKLIFSKSSNSDLIPCHLHKQLILRSQPARLDRLRFLCIGNSTIQRHDEVFSFFLLPFLSFLSPLARACSKVLTGRLPAWIPVLFWQGEWMIVTHYWLNMTLINFASLKFPFIPGKITTFKMYYD